MKHYYETIQGWFRAEDLYKSMVAEAPSNEELHFVEIGCWKGRSSVFLGTEIVNSGKNITLHCVDTFKGSEEAPHKNDPDLPELRALFRQNMQPLVDAGLRLEVHEMTSVEAAKQFNHAAYFIYIDGDHTYQAVKADIGAWLDKTSHILAGDDFDYSDTKAAVLTCLPNDLVQTDGSNWLVDVNILQKINWQIPTETKPIVYIATPTHDCKVWVGYMEALHEECKLLNQAGIAYIIGRYDGDSFISRCRDVMAAEFLSHTECTHIMWIDSDIAWPVGIVRDFVLQNKPIIAGAYPKKSLPINFVINAKSPEIDITDARYISIKDAGTGFLCVRRDVFEAIKDQCPRLYAENLSCWESIEDTRKYQFALHHRAYFSEMLEPVNNSLINGEQVFNRLTEDYAFCRRAQNVGIDILLAPLVPLAHFGAFVYDGDVAQHIEVEDGLMLRDAVDAFKTKASM